LLHVLPEASVGCGGDRGNKAEGIWQGNFLRPGLPLDVLRILSCVLMRALERAWKAKRKGLGKAAGLRVSLIVESVSTVLTYDESDCLLRLFSFTMVEQHIVKWIKNLIAKVDINTP
jgi:hypothetical protein